MYHQTGGVDQGTGFLEKRHHRADERMMDDTVRLPPFPLASGVMRFNSVESIPINRLRCSFGFAMVAEASDEFGLLRRQGAQSAHQHGYLRPLHTTVKVNLVGG